MDEYLKTKCTCPITKKIFFEPMMAKDGYIYEDQAITEWLANKKRQSPVTNNRMKEKLKPMTLLKGMISEYIKQNPSLREHQYAAVKSHSYNKRLLETYFNNSDHYEKLLDYNEFNMELFFSYDYPSSFVRNASINVLKHIIDNSIDIETQANNGHRLLHYVCEYSLAEVISHILSKNIELKCTGNSGKNILHLVCMNPNITIALLKTVISKVGVMHVEDACGNTPYDYLCMKNSDKHQLIKFFIDNIIVVKTPDEVSVANRQ